MNNPALNLTYRAPAFVPPVRFVPDHIIEVAGKGIAWKTTRFHEVVGSLVGETLSSHEALKDTLKLCGQGAGNFIVGPIVLVMTMSRIAASTIESQTGKVVSFQLPVRVSKSWVE